MADRVFRTKESLDEEQITRAMIAPFLRARGYTIESDLRVRNGQTIAALSLDGARIVARVKLCWRRGSPGRDEAHRSSYSAAQLMARVEDGDWEGSVRRKMDQERARGSTHILFVQRDARDISSAALVPIEAVPGIWCRQRDISDDLIRRGEAGRRTTNHAMNGQSPTLWLQDGAAGQKVADALWTHPAVVDLADIPSGRAALLPEEVPEPQNYEEGALKRVVINAYERDPKARAACLAHYGYACAVCNLRLEELYGPKAAGYIHVHHLRPLAEVGQAYLVDPVGDLRPVCPNCHAVIHADGGCRSIEEVRAMMRLARSRGAA